jgi:hypothetical protein
MNREQIITELYGNSRINYLVNIKAPKGLADDFKAELFVVLCEMDPDKLIGLHERGELVLWVCRIILNMATKTGQFHYKYRERDLSDYYRYLAQQNLKTVDKDILKRIHNQIHPKQGESGLDELNRYITEGREHQFHKIVIFREYIEFRSCDAVAAMYGVPKHYVNAVVKEVKQELRNAIRNNH